MRIIAKTAVTLGIAGAAVVTALGSAVADPPSGTTPAATDIAGVGSDTSQAVVDKLSTDYNATSPAKNMYSWDAIGSATISTKAGCASITRPNGSGAGITALKSNARPSGDTTNYCIDFARSSRGPQAGDTTAIAFVRMAQDAVTWSSTTTTSNPTNASSYLTTAELRAIYLCDSSQLPSGDTISHAGAVTWDEVRGTGTAAVVPVIPQSSSGTRSFFLKAIGFTSTDTLGSCVKGTDNSVEENEGTNAIFSSADKKNLIFPYSVAVYLAQSQNGHGTGSQGHQKLMAVATDPSGSTVINPTVGKAPSRKINTALGQVGLTRFIYNVVRNVGTQHIPSYMKPLVNSSGFFCKNATAKADIVSYGFNTISTCGTVDLPTS